MANKKAGIKNALLNYHKKHLKQVMPNQVKRKCGKPEKTVEKACLNWCKENDVFVHVVESSSYDPIARKTTVSKAQVGMSDLVGNDGNGLAVFIELKAKDRRSTLSDAQRDFLLKKISQNCFAVVVDSSEKLDDYYNGFCQLESVSDKQSYLLDCFPKKRAQKKRALDLF